MPSWFKRARCLTVAAALGVSLHAAAWADTPLIGRGGKLLLTGGVSTIDGAGGGGLTPWALIGGYGTDRQIGLAAHVSRADLRDYTVDAYGLLVGLFDRIELSAAHQDFDTGRTGVALGLPGLKLRQDIFGVKVRLFGDAILDSDRFLPQVAVGALYKDLDANALAGTLAALGAKERGTDIYVSATKLFLAQRLLVNGTLRATKANQNGLLGFGSTTESKYRLMPEFSVGYLLRKDMAVGAEYRFKPDNLNPSILGNGLREDNWADVFLAYAPSKNLSLTLAYVDLGRIVPAVIPQRQRGGYLSVQLAF